MIASLARSTRPLATIWIPSAARFARTPFATVNPLPSLSPSLPADCAASSSSLSSLSASRAASSRPSPSTSSAALSTFLNADATSFTASSRVSALRETFFNALSSSPASPFTSMMIEPSAMISPHFGVKPSALWHYLVSGILISNTLPHFRPLHFTQISWA